MTLEDPRRVVTDGKVSAFLRFWKQDDRPFVTGIVKVHLKLNPNAPMDLLEPRPVQTDDVTFGKNPTRSVEHPAETAPYLSKCDIVLTGFAYGGGRSSTAVRLAIFREQSPLLDKTIHVFGERNAAGQPVPFDKVSLTYEKTLGGSGIAANPVGTQKPQLVDPKDAQKPACFGPISRFWPVRKTLAVQLDSGPFFSASPTPSKLTTPAPWSFFQAAPIEQQTEYLLGNEWIVLDGMSPNTPRVNSRLPNLRPAGRLRMGSIEKDLPLLLDMLIIKADALECFAVFRGASPVESHSSTIEFAAALSSRTPAEWATLWTSPVGETAPRSTPAPVDSGDATAMAPSVGLGESTLGIAPWEQKAKEPSTPFVISGPDSAPVSNLTATPWGAPAPAPILPITAAVGESTLDLNAALKQPAPLVYTSPSPIEEPPPAPGLPKPPEMLTPPSPPTHVESPATAPPIQAAPAPEPAPKPEPPPPPRAVQRLREMGASEEALAKLTKLLERAGR
ncbi:MAG: DUF2169 domain-containing protein [Polyangiaceae bacterium]|nr:DUF2169 domain-containing protein [Polyangiaceae bacterium]